MQSLLTLFKGSRNKNSNNIKQNSEKGHFTKTSFIQADSLSGFGLSYYSYG